MVPTYEYQCDQCERTFEVRQRITAEPLKCCDVCGGPVRRLLSAAPFILKGEGWYVTDYPSESRKKAVESEKKTTSPAEKSSSAEKSSTSGSDATPTTSPSSTATPSNASSD